MKGFKYWYRNYIKLMVILVIIINVKIFKYLLIYKVKIYVNFHINIPLYVLVTHNNMIFLLNFILLIFLWKKKNTYFSK
jgi:hypothetical protein